MIERSLPSLLDKYLEAEANSLRIMPALKAILVDLKQALSELPTWERWAYGFWLLGPFILLIERSPADAWISILALVLLLSH